MSMASLQCVYEHAEISAQIEVKVLPQVSHEYGFSPVCVRTCLDKSPDEVKVLPQVSHEYGFSPVCVRTCTDKCSQMK